MTYSFGFDSKTFDKYATIQSDVEDMYLEDVEDEEELEDDELIFDEDETLAELVDMEYVA